MEHLPECVEPQIDYPCQQCWEIECECTCICDRLRACEQRVRDERLVDAIFHAPDSGARAFVLQRDTDVSGVSGTGTVAHGVEFPDGCVALRWVGGTGTVVFYDNGIASVEAIHGHGGNTRIVWTSEDMGERAAEMDEVQALGRQQGYAAGLDAAREAVLSLPVQWDRVDAYRDALAAIDALRGSGNPDTPPSAEKGEQA